MSIQSFAITRKVREVDLALEGTSDEIAGCVYEIHPEVCFARLNGNVPMIFAKKKSAGRTERLGILAEIFGPVPAQILSARDRKKVGADDVLDAFVALWSARRIGRGEAESLPVIPDFDECGRRMAIYY